MSRDFSARNKFVSQSHERLSLLRGDEEWRDNVLESGEAWIVPVWRQKLPVTATRELQMLRPKEMRAARLDDAILLGDWRGQAAFAVDMGEDDMPPRSLRDARFENLRSIGAMSPSDTAALAAYALAMVYWQRRHRFCGVCGTQTTAEQSGHTLVCTSRACGSRDFPRSDPAIIVLVTHDDRALLGRQPGWPAGVYSTIAGFVEPGESLENAVRREVAEETGVVVDEVHYHSSQPWPFPASLMLGFHASAASEEIRLRDDELEDAQWFSRDDIVQQVGEGMLALSAPISIAYRLIEHWFDASTPGELARHVAKLRS